MIQLLWLRKDHTRIIRIHKSSDFRIVISASQTVQSSLWIIDILSVAKWIQCCKGHATCILCGRYLTPAVILVSYHYLITAVNQTGDISKTIIQIEIVCLSIESKQEWLAFGIVHKLYRSLSSTCASGCGFHQTTQCTSIVIILRFCITACLFDALSITVVGKVYSSP